MDKRADGAEAARRIVDFAALAEGLKRELRHSWLSDGRQESVAEHSWHMALLAILVHGQLDEAPDLLHTLKMIVVHDLAEALVGDIPAFEQSARREAKKARETAAMDELAARLPVPVGAEVRALWLEYEDRQTPEARFAGALDNLEVQIQHNLAPIETWLPVEYEMLFTKMDRHCAHDGFLARLCTLVKEDGAAKIARAGADPDAIGQRAAGQAGAEL